MTRLSVRLLPVLLLALALPLSAQTYQSEVVNDLTGVKDKWVSLFDAMPDASMSWRPEDGVRSVSELYMHIALANIGLPTNLMGAPAAPNAPSGISEQTTDRATIRAALVAGFDHLIAQVRAASDASLMTPTNVFGRATNHMGAIMLMQTHSHEHLGQAIAYARTNGVTPPWSN